MFPCKHVIDEEEKEEEAKARATAGKCHEYYRSYSVNMITADVGVMDLHRC